MYGFISLYSSLFKMLLKYLSLHKFAEIFAIALKNSAKFKGKTLKRIIIDITWKCQHTQQTWDVLELSKAVYLLVQLCHFYAQGD